MKYFIFGVLFLLLGAFFSITNVDPFSKELLVRCPEGETPFDFPELNEIISKPLHYIGRGNEAIAFASADNQYVVKFFLTKRIITKQYIHPKKRLHQLSTKLPKIQTGETILKRYEQGLHALPDLTAMLAIHRTYSPKQLPKCTLIDYQGFKHSIDLNDYAFVIQRKGNIIKKKEFAKNRKILDTKFFDLFTALSNQGFVNLSPLFNLKNFALLDDKAVIIDLGKLEYVPEKAYKLGEEHFQCRYEKAL